MSSTAAQKLDSRDSARQSSGSGRLYVLAVTALAVFLVGLVVCGRPAGDHVANALLTHRVHADAAAFVTEAAAQIKSPANFRRAVTELSLATANDRRALKLPSEKERDRWIDENASRVEVSTSKAAHPDQTLITVQYRGENSALAVALVDNLAKHYVREHSPAGPQDGDPVPAAQRQRDVASALARLQRSRQQLEAFLREHFDELQKLEDASTAVGSPKQTNGTMVKPADDVAAEQVVSPERAELQTLLAEFRRKSHDLLRQRTPQHPEVIDVQLQIEEIEARLAELKSEQSRARDVPHNSQRPKSEDVAPDAALVKAAIDIDALCSRFQTLHLAHEEASVAYDQAVRRQRQGWEQRLAAVASRVDMVRPAKIVWRGRQQLTAGRVLVLGLAALAFGLIVAWAAGPAKLASKLASVAEVRRLLRVPIVGAISTTDGPELPRRPQIRPRLVRFVTRASELTLAVSVLLVVLTTMVDSPVAGQFVDDPLGTFSETFSRASEWFL